MHIVSVYSLRMKILQLWRWMPQPMMCLAHMRFEGSQLYIGLQKILKILQFDTRWVAVITYMLKQWQDLNGLTPPCQAAVLSGIGCTSWDFSWFTGECWHCVVLDHDSSHINLPHFITVTLLSHFKLINIVNSLHIHVLKLNVKWCCIGCKNVGYEMLYWPCCLFYRGHRRL